MGDHSIVSFIHRRVHRRCNCVWKGWSFFLSFSFVIGVSTREHVVLGAGFLGRLHECHRNVVIVVQLELISAVQFLLIFEKIFKFLREREFYWWRFVKIVLQFYWQSYLSFIIKNFLTVWIKFVYRILYKFIYTSLHFTKISNVFSSKRKSSVSLVYDYFSRRTLSANVIIHVLKLQQLFVRGSVKLLPPIFWFRCWQSGAFTSIKHPTLKMCVALTESHRSIALRGQCYRMLEMTEVKHRRCSNYSTRLRFRAESTFNQVPSVQDSLWWENRISPISGVEIDCTFYSSTRRKLIN